MECEEFFVCFSTRHLEIFVQYQGLVVAVYGDQKQPRLTLTILIVQGQGVIPTSGVHIVITRVVTGCHQLTLGDLLIDRLTFRRCLEKERCQVNLWIEGLVSAVLVEGPVGGGAQVPGQVEIVIELALARHAPPPRHAVRVKGRGVALAPAPSPDEEDGDA